MNTIFGEVASVTDYTVTLTDGRTAHFDPANARSEALAKLVEDLTLVYLEVDASQQITRVRIPTLLRIATLTDTSVTFHPSAARHEITPALAKTLREHFDRQLAVTTDDSGAIIDVRPYG